MAPLICSHRWCKVDFSVFLAASLPSLPAINSAMQAPSGGGAPSKRKALQALVQAPSAGSKRRSTAKPKLKIGFICGREDDDHVLAPGIPRERWVSKGKKGREMVCSDVALWWCGRAAWAGPSLGLHA